MAALVKFLAVLIVAAVAGLGATFFAVDRELGFNVVTAGPWRSVAKAGTAEIDPYTRARFARTGAAPLALVEGVNFVARTDSDGAALFGRCDYLFRGPVPAARFWTLTVLAPDGKPLQAPTERRGFVSSEILRAESGDFDIVLAPRARAGNWLPTPAQPYVLMLRLYDTALSNSGASLDAAAMPKLVKRGCA